MQQSYWKKQKFSKYRNKNTPLVGKITVNIIKAQNLQRLYNHFREKFC